MKRFSKRHPSKMYALAFLLVATSLLGVYHFILKYHTEMTLRKAYESGFMALVEQEFSKNRWASKPELTITEIFETKEGLSISYKLEYREKFEDGEEIKRKTTGVAILKRESATQGKSPKWQLQQVQNAVQTLRFTKGSTLGT